MEQFKAFLVKKDIQFSVKRYGIDALSAMAQGLFCSLLIGTILNTLGTQLHISCLTATIATKTFEHQQKASTRPLHTRKPATRRILGSGQKIIIVSGILYVP